MEEEVQLPEALVKELCDKSLDKRESGAKNLEQNIINPLVDKKNEKNLRAIIRYIKTKFVASNQLYHKLGGLQALNAIASALSKDDILAEKFVVEITNGMLECFMDKDDKVRYAGIEYLFNVCLSLKEIVLINFNDIFEQLMMRSVVDADEKVKKAANQLTNKLKGIITIALPEKRYFNVSEFMPILCQSMTKAANPVARNVLINWISTLNSIPNIEMFDQLPKFLEHLFVMLGDPYKDVREAAQKQMNEFMSEIEPYSRRNFYKEDQAVMTHGIIIDILIKICNSKMMALNAQKVAISWIGEYLRIFSQQLDSEMIQNASDQGQSGFISVKQFSVPVQPQKESALRRVIMSKLSYILEPILALLSHEDDDIRKNAQFTNELLQNIMDKVKNTSIEFMNILPTVQQMYNEKKSHTAQSALKWMHILFKTYSDKVLPTINDILSNLIERLIDADSSVIENLMDLLGSISLHEQYFDLVFEKILNVFYQDSEILQKRSDIIIKKLCEILNPQQVYTTISSKLIQRYSRQDAHFISQVVQTLEHILITEKGLKPMRTLLRNIKYEAENKEEHFKFFETIYTTFCFNQVSILTLSLLAEEYELSYHLVLSFADVEQDVSTLVQVAKLIYMLESPIFAYLRLQLLEHQKYPYLLKTLKGLLMLLPQTSVQKKLKQRLSTIGVSTAEDKYVFEKDIVCPIDVQKMLEIFRTTRAKVNKSKGDSLHKDDN